MRREHVDSIWIEAPELANSDTTKRWLLSSNTRLTTDADRGWSSCLILDTSILNTTSNFVHKPMTTTSAYVLLAVMEEGHIATIINGHLAHQTDPHRSM